MKAENLITDRKLLNIVSYVKRNKIWKLYFIDI